MKAKQPVLSISILISGREEMRKCLESLRPFLEELNCELILVDTGCNEEQLAIAREYTDIIIPFTWCNDFSAARNAGLKKATGEWFMFLDDDEWFEDPSEIVFFFKSGEYKKYNGGYYKVRNHVDYSGENYADRYVSRLIKKTKETCFRGKIHEELYPMYAPTKKFHTHVEHYGYVYTSEEEKRQHAQRNISLLVEAMKAEPDYMRWYAQLTQEYLVLGEYEKGVETALNGIQRYEDSKNAEQNQFYIYAELYGFAALQYQKMGAMQEAEKVLEKGLEKIKGLKSYRAYLLQSAVAVFYELNRYSDCIEAAEEYLNIYDKARDDSKNGFLIAQNTFEEEFKVPVLIRASLAAAMEKRYDKLEYFFFRIDWQDSRMLGQQELEKCIIEAILDRPYQEVFSRMMKAMGERERGMDELHPILLQIEWDCKKRGKTEKLERLWKLVAEIESEHFYVLMARIYYLNRWEDREGIVEVFHKIFEMEESVLDIREDIWELAEHWQISVEPLFINMDFGKWRRALEKWVYVALAQDAEAWEKRCEAWECKNDIRCLLLKIRCKEVILRRNVGKADIEILEMQLNEYAKEVLTYYRILYKEEIFTGMPEALPDEARLSLRYLKVKEARMSMNGLRVIKELREMLDIYPVLEEMTLHYAKMLKEDVERQSKEAENAQKELDLLVKSLKSTAKLRIQRGEYQVAREILAQVQRCVPKDEEVDELLKQIGGFNSADER